MIQKKAVIVLAVIAILGLIASMTWAGPWEGHRYYNNSYRSDNRPFSEETANIRSEPASKRGEYRTFMAQDNPDPQRAAELQRNIVQLEEQNRAKTQAYRDTRRYGRDGRGPGGGGWAHHRSGGHRGGGYCW